MKDKIKPNRVLDFFAAARQARRSDLTEQRVSPSSQEPQFKRLYGPVNQPYNSFRESEAEAEAPGYEPRNDGPGAA